MMTIKGRCMLEHAHVKAVFGRNISPVKIGPQIVVFRKFKGLNIDCRHRHPQKAHPWLERGLLAYL